MAEIQMVQLKGQTAGVSSKAKRSSQSDFSGMLKEVSQSVSEQKKPAEAAGDESAKAASRDEVRESSQDKGQITDSEDKVKTEQDGGENTEPAEESEFADIPANLTGEEIAQLTGMMASLSQNTQDNNGQQSGELLQTANEEVAVEGLEGEADRILTEEADPLAELADSANRSMNEKSVNESGGQLSAEDDGAMEMTAGSQSRGQSVEIAEAEETVQSEHGLDNQVKRSEQSEGAEQAAEYSAAENRPVQTAQSLTAPGGTEVLKTSPETLTQDVSESIVSNMFSKDAPTTLELTLEPASLGKITIRLIYEEGRAALSLISDNPKTLELLSQKVGDIAQILQEKTGQDTVVYTPETQYTEQDTADQQGGGRQQEHQERPKQEQTESFMQQLRLGLI